MNNGDTKSESESSHWVPKVLLDLDDLLFRLLKKVYFFLVFDWLFIEF